MKAFLFFFAITTSIFSFGQRFDVVGALLINDSMFYQSKSSYCDFTNLKGGWYHPNRSVPTNVNNIFSLKNDSLKFEIHFGCGCGSNESKLVSNGILQTDSSGKKFYELKFVFMNNNKGCEVLCGKRLTFDIYELKRKECIQPLYIKIVGFQDFIKYDWEIRPIDYGK